MGQRVDENQLSAFKKGLRVKLIPNFLLRRGLFERQCVCDHVLAAANDRGHVISGRITTMYVANRALALRRAHE